MEGRRTEHAPVMLAEVMGLLQCKPGGLYVDATAGLGGHSLAILESIQPTGLLIAIGRQIGVGIENAQLYESEQVRRDEAERRRLAFAGVVSIAMAL